MNRQLWTAFILTHWVLFVLSFGMMLIWWKNKVARLLFIGQAAQSASFSSLPFVLGSQTIRNSSAVLLLADAGCLVALVAVSLVCLTTVGLRRNGGSS